MKDTRSAEVPGAEIVHRPRSLYVHQIIMKTIIIENTHKQKALSIVR